MAVSKPKNQKFSKGDKFSP